MSVEHADKIKKHLDLRTKDAVAKMPLKLLKRLLAASANEPKYDAHLSAPPISDDPEHLRKEFEHFCQNDQLKLMEKFNVAAENEFVLRNIKENDKIFWLEHAKSDSSPDYDHLSGEFHHTQWYAILTFAYDTQDRLQPCLRIFETIFQDHGYQDDGYHESKTDMHVHAIFYLSLYQLIAWHPKLIPRILLLLGGVEELIKALNMENDVEK